MKSKTLDLTMAALFAVLIAICSWLQIPSAVPFTLQTFAVFLSLILLGGKRGTAAIAVYILMGAVGLPVLHGFTGGIGILMGSTGGYIFGFILIAAAYRIITKKAGEKLWVKALALLVGMVICYISGTAWFVAVSANNNGFGAALLTCVVPFIVPDLLKLGLALLLGERLKKLIKFPG